MCVALGCRVSSTAKMRGPGRREHPALSQPLEAHQFVEPGFFPAAKLTDVYRIPRHELTDVYCNPRHSNLRIVCISAPGEAEVQR